VKSRRRTIGASLKESEISPKSLRNDAENGTGREKTWLTLFNLNIDLGSLFHAPPISKSLQAREGGC
jgi:hypothetical protein